MTIDDVDFVNDSKSTNIDSLRVALESFTKPITLIAGGRGKGADYRVLRDLMKQHVATMIAIGEDTQLLEAAFGDIVAHARASSMEEAVRLAAQSTAKGGVVLLSPACASFDMFDNFEHRGRVFKECVHRYAEGVRQ
jgi:UDP-N-acetylmuramoylalanine--D-glutamate ligase